MSITLSFESRQDYYYTTVSWVDEEKLLVTWLTREQTVGSISLCTFNESFQDAYMCRTVSDDDHVDK